MKKILTTLLIVSLICGQSMAAGNAARRRNSVASASEQNTESNQENRIKIGVAASVQGTVRITGGSRGIVKSGMDIYLNDHVITGNTGSLQIMLLDETVFTLGPNSDLVLDEFVYNPNTQSGKVSAKVTKGIFRFITGKIARKDPSRMNVRTHAGNIGIRGTIVVGQTGPEGSTIILAGPGVNNNAGERPGAVEFTLSSDNPVSIGDNTPLNDQGNDNQIPGTTQTVLLTNTGDGIQTVEDKTLKGPPAPMFDTLSQLNGELDKNINQNGNGNEGDIMDDGTSGSGQNTGNDGDNSGSSNGKNDEEGQTGGKTEDEPQETLNDQTGQSGADTQNDANDNKANENNVSDINTLISQTTQDSNVEENAVKNQLYPITYNQLASLPDNNIMRAEYNTGYTPITGTKSDGSVITRFLSFSTVFNFLDKLFQDTYLTLSGNPGDESSVYYKYDGDRYNNVSSHYDGDNEAIFNLSYSGIYMGTHEHDPELSTGNEYDGFTADLAFSKTAAGNAWPTLTADIKMTTSNEELTLAGTYDIAGNTYDGNLTANEISKIAESGLTSAVYSANAIISPSNCIYPCTYNHIGLNLLATVDFEDASLSDMVLTLTPDSDAERNGNVVFYSADAAIPLTSSYDPGYYETSSVFIDEELSSNKISNLKTDPSDSNILGLDLNLSDLTIYAGNYSDVRLYVDYASIDLEVTVSTGTMWFNFDETANTGGGKYQGSDHYLTKNEFNDISANLVSAGLPLAQYTYNGLIPMPSRTGSDDGITMSGFKTIVDFENDQVRDTGFFLTSGITTDKIYQVAPADITGALGTHYESNGNFSILTPYASDNKNAYAAAILNLSNSTDLFTNAVAELYFTKNNNAYPGMDVFLNFDYSGERYGTYNSSGEDNPFSISDIVRYEDTAHKTAQYQGYGSWIHTDYSSPVGDMFRTSLSVDFDFTDGIYSNAKAEILSLANNTSKNVYINNTGGLLDGNTLAIPLDFDSSASGSILAVEDVDYNGEQILYANVTTDEALDVPSIYAVLNPATSSIDDYFTSQSELYRTDVKTLYDYDALRTGVASAGDHRAIWTTMINLTDFSADNPISSITVLKELEIAFNADSGLTLLGSYRLQGIGSYDNVVAEINNAITANTMTGQALNIQDQTSVTGTADIMFYNHNNAPAVQIDMNISDSISSIDYTGSVAHIGFSPN